MLRESLAVFRNDVQAIGKMVEFKPGKEGHLIYDFFVIK